MFRKKPNLDKRNYNEVIEKYNNIESSFPQYISKHIPIKLNLEQENAQKQAKELYDLGNLFYQEKNYQEALNQFQISLKLSGDLPNNKFLSQVNASMASTLKFLGDFDKAEEKFEISIDQALQSYEHKKAEELCLELAILHQENGSLDNYIAKHKDLLQISKNNNQQIIQEKCNLALGAGYLLLQGEQYEMYYKKVIDSYSQAYLLSQGKIDYEADRVEQHEVGFSDKKIGTDNIRQCVAVIIRDPESKKTALAHIDIETKISSLSDKVINQFPHNAKLEIYLIGGLDRIPEAIDDSNNNIKRIFAE